MARWWLVSDAGEVDLCRENPGYDVDLLVRCTVRTMTEVWMCRRSHAAAERAGELQVLGAQSLKQRLPLWLRGSALARLGAESLVADPIAS
jgi:hypothetical protein